MDECPFCILGGQEEDDLIVVRTPLVFVVPSLRQRRLNRGHMLVLPIEHITRSADLVPAQMTELYSVAARISLGVREVFGASGILMFHNENIENQVLHHLHLHVVPRSIGDNFRLPDPASEEVSQTERRQQSVALRRALAPT